MPSVKFRAPQSGSVSSAPTILLPGGFDEFGYPLTKRGEPDRRHKRVYVAEKAVSSKSSLTLGQMRQARMTEVLSGKPWDFVREGYEPAGTHSATGFAVKSFVVLKNRDTGEEIRCGRGECVKYAKVSIPSRTRAVRNATTRTLFREAFPDTASGSTESSLVASDDSAEYEDDEDLSFMDER